MMMTMMIAMMAKYNSSSNNSSKKKAVKVVSFSNEVNVIYTLHRSDYSIQELGDSYYSVQDIHEFREDAKLAAKTIESSRIYYNNHNNGSNTNNKIDYCIRGIEHLTSIEINQKRWQRKRNSINAVLLHQQQQQEQQEMMMIWQRLEEEDTTTNTIAEVYSKSVQECTSKAYDNGLSDAIEARSVYCEDLQQLRSRDHHQQQQQKQHQLKRKLIIM